MGRFSSFMFGGAVGVVVGLLIAPRPGEETRALVADKVDEYWGMGQDFYTKGVTRVQAGVATVAPEPSERGDELRDKIENARNLIADQVARNAATAREAINDRIPVAAEKINTVVDVARSQIDSAANAIRDRAAEFAAGIDDSAAATAAADDAPAADAPAAAAPAADDAPAAADAPAVADDAPAPNAADVVTPAADVAPVAVPSVTEAAATAFADEA